MYDLRCDKVIVGSAARISSWASGTNQLMDVERVYLQAAEEGDLATVKRLLDRADELALDPNCTDQIGRGVLRLAIEKEHFELLQLLVKSRKIQLSDGLLHAVNAENIPAVETLLRAQGERGGQKNIKGFLGQPQSSSFTPDITPLILAAHLDNYVIVKLLLDAGERIEKPHDIRCACPVCAQSRRTDGLQHSKRRLNAFRALASPSVIILTSSDPILTAFEMNLELRKMGWMEKEFQVEYKELADKCEEFATALLAETRNSEELTVVLNHDTYLDHVGLNSVAGLRINGEAGRMSDSADEGEALGSRDGWHHAKDNEAKELARLKLAISYDQKKFVAHPHCQQLLASIWYEGLPGLRQKHLIAQLAIIALFCLLFPFLSACYMLAPNSKLGMMIKRPFIKFLCHTSAYISFIMILALAAMRIEFIDTLHERMNERGPLPSLFEAAAAVYVLGFIWQQIKLLYSNGLATYMQNMWNLLDFVTNSLYIATFAMRFVAWMRVHVYNEEAKADRGDWDAYDPILISECLFAAGNILSTLRLVQLFTVSPQLGPLQISLGRMLFDIFKFFCIYVLVIVAFAFGLNQIFWFYAKNRERVCTEVSFTLEESQKSVYDYCITRGTYFTNLFEIAQSLYWSTYGLIDLTNFNLEFDHTFTEFVGKLTFGAYSYIAFIVLLNMLIAMMNSSYEQIVWLRKRFPCCNAEERQRNYWQFVKNHIKAISHREARYKVVMRELTWRYTIHKLASHVQEPVTTDHLNEIKGDISSFRHEMINILQSNGMRIPDIHSRSIKRIGASGENSVHFFETQLSKSSRRRLDSDSSDQLDLTGSRPRGVLTKSSEFDSSIGQPLSRNMHRSFDGKLHCQVVSKPPLILDASKLMTQRVASPNSTPGLYATDELSQRTVSRLHRINAVTSDDNEPSQAQSWSLSLDSRTVMERPKFGIDDEKLKESGEAAAGEEFREANDD